MSTAARDIDEPVNEEEGFNNFLTEIHCNLRLPADRDQIQNELQHEIKRSVMIKAGIERENAQRLRTEFLALRSYMARAHRNSHMEDVNTLQNCQKIVPLNHVPSNKANIHDTEKTALNYNGAAVNSERMLQSPFTTDANRVIVADQKFDLSRYNTVVGLNSVIFLQRKMRKFIGNIKTRAKEMTHTFLGNLTRKNQIMDSNDSVKKEDISVEPGNQPGTENAKKPVQNDSKEQKETEVNTKIAQKIQNVEQGAALASARKTTDNTAKELEATIKNATSANDDEKKKIQQDLNHALAHQAQNKAKKQEVSEIEAEDELEKSILSATAELSDDKISQESQASKKIISPFSSLRRSNARTGPYPEMNQDNTTDNGQTLPVRTYSTLNSNYTASSGNYRPPPPVPFPTSRTRMNQPQSSYNPMNPLFRQSPSNTSTRSEEKTRTTRYPASSIYTAARNMSSESENAREADIQQSKQTQETRVQSAEPSNQAQANSRQAVNATEKKQPEEDFVKNVKKQIQMIQGHVDQTNVLLSKLLDFVDKKTI